MTRTNTLATGVLTSGLFATALLALAGGDAAAQISGDMVKIGVLTDQSGNFSALSGPGSVQAAERARAVCGAAAPEKPIQLVNADHQNKTDIGLAIARRWYDADGVDVIVDV